MVGIQFPAGVRKSFKPCVPCIRRRLILRITPPPDDLAAPPDESALLIIVVVLPSFGRLDVSMLVDVERAPYPSVASRLSAASSNILNQPLICPFPPLHLTLVKI
jgi:hypothetical protein